MTGVVAGIVNSGSFVGSALLQPVFGVVLDRGWQGAVEQGVRIYPPRSLPHRLLHLRHRPRFGPGVYRPYEGNRLPEYNHGQIINVA